MKKFESNRTELCLLKIFGIKTLVKSYLPVRDAHQRPGIERVMEILKNILSFGDISEDMESSAVDKAHMRLASAKAVLRLSRQWDHKIPIDVFYMTLRISEDTYAQSRKVFISKVQRYIKERLLDAKYACAFLLNINQFRSPEYTEGKHNLLEIIQVCQQAKVRQLSMQSDGNSTVAYPECILVYLVHALAHHPSFPSIDERRDLKVFEPFYWRLHLLLSLLLHGDEGGQFGGDPSKRENYIKVVSIFHSIKCSEDAVDSAKSKVSYAICDLGLSMAKRLVNDQSDISGMATSLTLPPNLYKPVKEGEKSAGNDDQSWLGNESVLAHFEALKLEDKEPSVSGADKDEMILEEKDADGNEMPLGKLMKLLKSQGVKKKKRLKRQASPSETKKPENDFDVLGVVREINLDNMKSEKSRQIGELTKDNDSSESQRMSIDNDEEGASVSRKRKETNGIALLNAPTPKRKRSAKVQRSPSKSAKGENGSRVLSYSRANNVDKKKGLSSAQKLLMEDVESSNPDLLVSHLPTIKSTSSRNYVEPKTKEAIIKNEEKSAILGVTDKEIGSSESSKGSLKKRKVRSISGLEKCSSHGILLNNEELVGSRIKVWWPLDKAFYEGVVQSYDPGKKKYMILYDDGDVEVLNLNKEKWEPIANSDIPKKQQNFQQSPSHKEMPFQKINKKSSSSSSRKKVNSAKKGRRKPALKKRTELNCRKASKNESHTDGSDAEGKGDSDLVDAHFHSGSEVDDVSSDRGHKGNTPLEAEDKTTVKSVQSLEEPLHEEKSDPTRTHVEENSDDEPPSK
ncbi:uncharacterized protein A4U43_C05F22220 [Asparagus officinalis]|uniref:Tudor domain-containing protein n=2 Tax=Asparagus officinalis TaxID=4686 RepID=A0A5P1EW29_ASPOF|nr:uncharacterized protein A4U43_C05F22220 [Asparagus officinalis]